MPPKDNLTRYRDQIQEDTREAKANETILKDDLKEAIQRGASEKEMATIRKQLTEAGQKAAEMASELRKTERELKIMEGDEQAEGREGQRQQQENKAEMDDERRGELALQREEKEAQARRFERENSVRREGRSRAA